jgi:ribosomal protein S18 acetylase RimI-like enzyme
MAEVPEAAFDSKAIRTRTGRNLTISAYRVEDFAALALMYKGFEPKRVAQGLPPPDVPRIAQWLDRLQQKSRGLLAWDGDAVVAHVILCPMPASAVEYTVFVHQDYRQEGLGTAISRLALGWAVNMGFELAYLTTELTNIRALRLFRKLGFQTTSSDGDEVEMVMNLTASASAPPQAA